MKKKKRFIKNFIILLMIIISFCGIVFTIIDAKNYVISHNETIEKYENPNEIGHNSNIQIKNTKTVVLPKKYYSYFALQGFLFVGLITYLFMSTFNKKTFKETFNNFDRITLYGLTLLIVNTGIIYILRDMTNNYILYNLLDENKINDKLIIEYKSVKKIEKDLNINSGDYESKLNDQNIILITNKINTRISNTIMTKVGDTNDLMKASNYGINSVLLNKDKANTILRNIIVNSNGIGANGIFNYGEDSSLSLIDSRVNTKLDNSTGVVTLNKAITNISNTIIETTGVTSPGVSTDHTVYIDSGSIKTNNQDSPVIISKGDVHVKNTKLESIGSEGIIIDGKGLVKIRNSELIDTNTKLNKISNSYKNIFIYKSDENDESYSEFVSSSSKITTNKGDTFYITNTNTKITLENNEIVNNDLNGNFINIKKDTWGKDENNGGNVKLVLTNQDIKGNILVDQLSKLQISLKNGSSYTGSINNKNESKNITLNLDDTSKITLTNNIYVKSFKNSIANNSNINFNGFKIFVNGKSIN